MDGSWQLLPGTATDIGAGADGSVWTIGTAANPGGDPNDHPILYFDASTWSFKPVDGMAMSIAVAPDDQPWVVNASGRIYRRTRGAAGYVDGAWQSVTGTARDIGVGSDGSVWTIGTNQLAGGYGISRYDATSGTWQAISGAGVRIAVDAQGAPWVVNAGGQVWRYTASGGWASYGSASIATGAVGGR